MADKCNHVGLRQNMSSAANSVAKKNRIFLCVFWEKAMGNQTLKYGINNFFLTQVPLASNGPHLPSSMSILVLPNPTESMKTHISQNKFELNQ